MTALLDHLMTATALLNHLDELDRLWRTARTAGMPPEKFISGLHDAMQKVQALLLLAGRTNSDFLDADYTLTETIAAYEKHPTRLVIGKIGNALVRYRRSLNEACGR
jgi:hypothetical protein